MATETTFSHARANLAALCDQATSTREPIVIHRQGSEALRRDFGPGST
jgi:PHD/YefM family antitoxin component YafN of YafNO toxin-antitoxin module